MDMVNFKTAQIIFKARNNLLPGNIQKMFFNREGDYNLRGEHKLKQLRITTTRKSQCITICGVNLWNGLDLEKRCNCNTRNSNSGPQRESLISYHQANRDIPIDQGRHQTLLRRQGYLLRREG